MKKIILILLIIHCSLLIVRAQWILQNSGTNQNLYDIEFINDKTGWAVGDAGVVIKTTNGGTNWLNIPNPSGQYGGLLWSVCPVDSEVVYIVAGYDFIMKTNNGGTNWNVISGRPGSITAFKSVFFLNRDTGWFLGTNKVFRTYDGANTLDSFYAPWFTNSDIYFKNMDTGIFCGDGRVFKSIDRGETWFNTNVPVVGTFYMFRKLAVLGENVWIADGIVFKSTNFCETWEIPDSIHSVSGSAINFINKDTGFAGGGSNRLYKTVNGGYNWIRQRTDSLSFAFISSIDFVNDSVGWYSCGAGKIYKTTTGGQIQTKIITTANEIPGKYILYQNFPNPFNPITTISYEIKKTAFVEIELFNVSGSKISSIEKGNRLPGYYPIKLGGENLISGLYFYNLKIDGKVIDVKKLVILK